MQEATSRTFQRLLFFFVVFGFGFIFLEVQKISTTSKKATTTTFTWEDDWSQQQQQQQHINIINNNTVTNEQNNKNVSSKFDTNSTTNSSLFLSSQQHVNGSSNIMINNSNNSQHQPFKSSTTQSQSRTTDANTNANPNNLNVNLPPNPKKNHQRHEQRQQPNIILILTDQQNSQMIGHLNKYVHTPAMDYLISNGMRFTRAYTTNPVCCPARIGIMTGRIPSTVNAKVKVRDNSKGRRLQSVLPYVNQTTLGSWMHYMNNNNNNNIMHNSNNSSESYDYESSYDLIYGGKQHLPKCLLPSTQNFHVLTQDERDRLSKKAVEFILERNNNNNKINNNNKQQKPYLMWLNYINPHDICFMGPGLYPKIYKYDNDNDNSVSDKPILISRPMNKKATKELKRAMKFPIINTTTFPLLLTTTTTSSSNIQNNNTTSTSTSTSTSSNKNNRKTKPIGSFRTDEDLLEEMYCNQYCPPLPINHLPQMNEPKTIKRYMDSKSPGFFHGLRNVTKEYGWRRRSFAYGKLTEHVDEQINAVLQTLIDLDELNNTMIIFSSDHGEMNGAHKMNDKNTLYEESINVPFVVMYKGIIKPNTTNNQHLVSHLDILPTIVDYAFGGIPPKSSDDDPRRATKGMTLRPLLEEEEVEVEVEEDNNEEKNSDDDESSVLKWRTTLGIDSIIGRMVINHENYKYIRYDFKDKKATPVVGEEEEEEELHDLNLDPYETKSYIDSPEHQSILQQLRIVFETEWFPPPQAAAPPAPPPPPK